MEVDVNKREDAGETDAASLNRAGQENEDETLKVSIDQVFPVTRRFCDARTIKKTSFCLLFSAVLEACSYYFFLTKVFGLLKTKRHYFD